MNSDQTGKIDCKADIDWYLEEHYGYSKELSAEILVNYSEYIFRNYFITFKGFQKYLDNHVHLSGFTKGKITANFVVDKLDPDFQVIDYE